MYRVVVVALLLAASLTGCKAGKNPWDNVPGGPPRVLVSFPPLYCFTKSVAGDDCAVLSLLTTVGPHDHKPSADDALAVAKADLFIVNGLGLDPFVHTIVKSSANHRLKIVPVAEVMPEGRGPGKRISVKEIMEGLRPGDEKPHVHGDDDPHAWLGIEEAILMVDKIRDELMELDPAHKDGYQQRAAAYVKELRELKDYGLKLLAGKTQKSLIVQHDSLKYFARTFGLKVVGAIQSGQGDQPDAKSIKALLDKCLAREAQLIAVEPQYPKAAAKRLQEMARTEAPDLAIITIDPLETAPADSLDVGYYTRMMRANLETLAKHLK